LIRKLDSSNNGLPPVSKMGEGYLPVEIRLASWVDRFAAWLIDFIIVSIGLGILFALIAFPFWISNYGNDVSSEKRNIEPFHYFLSSLTFLAYWTYFEYRSGQSIGKRLLNIKVTDMSGNAVEIKAVVLQSFGKSFLLPVDVILGWLFTNNKRQRIFNKLSNTIVIKLKPRDERTENIRYKKD
jgi:uncharacterized RDD family membrane protein YckC